MHHNTPYFIAFLLTCLLRGMTQRFPTSWSTAIVSTHMPLARHDLPGSHRTVNTFPFLLTCLLRGMTKIGWSITSPSEVSTHMPLARHDKSMERSGGYIQFLLTCLLRGMTSRSYTSWCRNRFLLTCLLRGMTVQQDAHRHLPTCFYSHASCEA